MFTVVVMANNDGHDVQDVFGPFATEELAENAREALERVAESEGDEDFYAEVEVLTPWKCQPMPKMNRPVYVVISDCCLCGNCPTCMLEPGHKFGERVRIVQFVTYLQSMANRVCHNFREYGANVALTNNVSQMNTIVSSSREWLESVLMHPETINDIEFKAK